MKYPRYFVFKLPERGISYFRIDAPKTIPKVIFTNGREEESSWRLGYDIGYYFEDCREVLASELALMI